MKNLILALTLSVMTIANVNAQEMSKAEEYAMDIAATVEAAGYTPMGAVHVDDLWGHYHLFSVTTYERVSLLVRCNYELCEIDK